MASFWFAITAVLAILGSGQADLIDGPENIAAEPGDVLILPCSAANSPPHRVVWTQVAKSNYDRPILISDGDRINQDFEEKHRFSIEKGNSTDNFHLRISPALTTDGGLYVCQDVLASSPQKFAAMAELTVIVTEPVCSSTIPENGVITVGVTYRSLCTVTMSGNIRANVTWVDQYNTPLPQIPGDLTRMFERTAEVEFQADWSMDRNSHSCEVYFTDYFLPVGADRAANVPEYKKSICQSPVLTVVDGTEGNVRQ